ncbi:hypothetical protein GA0115256_102738 [Streptomyces sp. DconLS]|nr:hypothetical protein GA0115256_102738 [Streptomyces sp. DconLS]SCF96126.1 hypothetical protein GA0115258_119024 [Streptomyces sp. LamerLS-31b]
MTLWSVIATKPPAATSGRLHGIGHPRRRCRPAVPHLASVVSSDADKADEADNASKAAVASA